MPTYLKHSLFALFLASGFCGLLYQVVWIRLALASFGVITPFVSVVVSVFMLGLSVGSWMGGRWIAGLTQRTGRSAIVFYAAAEAIIASGALVVPWLFATGRAILLPLGQTDSGAYLLLSSIVILLSMLPWCICMGVTYPFVMAYIEEFGSGEETSFSFLYLANVIGAMCGAVLTSFVLIELIGFRACLHLAGLLNFAIACIALTLWRRGATPRVSPTAVNPARSVARESAGAAPLGPGAAMASMLLFATGFTSMALEIVWMRAFTPVMGTLVYAFAALLSVYLLATWLGSLAYRRARSADRGLAVSTLVTLIAVAALLPNLASDPRIIVALNRLFLTAGSGSLGVPLALLSIFPFCALLGYLTPMLIDADARGNPSRAGIAYAINIIGSILGPLAAAYLLLPWLGSRISMLILASPFIVLFPALWFRARAPRSTARFMVAICIVVGVVVGTGFRGISYEEGSHLRDAEVRRDHTATVISFGRGMKRQLVVNGHGMTTLSPLTKIMAHLPLASLRHEPKEALVIAFGMGTTFRSLLSWPIEATAVELVPSVVDAFGFYFDDADAVRANPRGHVVVDDGRRYLARTDRVFDLITIDPPPPVEAAGSSLLYAREFYGLAKRRLAPGGILHQWFPNAGNVEPAIRMAVLRSIVDSFEYVRIFRSIQGHGLHILCSMDPIDVPSGAEFQERLPPAARRDLLEWSRPGLSAESFAEDHIMDREVPLESIFEPDFEQAISDDRPFNEYFILRRQLGQ